MFSLSPAVAQSLQQRRATVALESTVIAHGLPAPHNLETARACEQAVLDAGAVPATIGIIAGQPVIGLSEDQVREVERTVRANDDWRLRQTINLIASENVLSARARALLPSDFGHRYAEGHPEKGKRYYQGTRHIDVVEADVRDRMR